MTYSIIARCPRTGRLGIGITTYSIAVGGRTDGVRADAGICKTQAFANRANDPIAVGLLAQGYTPGYVMRVLEENDPDHEYRQIAILDRDGNAAAHTGNGTRSWSGHHIGDGFVAFGNVLAGAQVVEAIADGFASDPAAPLEFRLLAALEAGRRAGGQVGGEGHLPERSAAIRVVAHPDYPDIDVRVDLHPDAVTELRRVLEEFKLYEVFYRERGRKPREAITQDEFVARLEKTRAEGRVRGGTRRLLHLPLREGERIGSLFRTPACAPVPARARQSCASAAPAPRWPATGSRRTQR